LAGVAQRNEHVDKIDPRVEDRDESIRHPVRRTFHRITFLRTASHTEFRTRPGIRTPRWRLEQRHWLVVAPFGRFLSPPVSLGPSFSPGSAALR
jgi:hypothetical protein